MNSLKRDMLRTILFLTLLLQACISNPHDTDERVKLDLNNYQAEDDFLARFERFTCVEEVTEISQKSGKPAFVFFTGHTCMGCKKQEKLLFSSKEIQETLLQNFHCFIAHVDDKTFGEQHSATCITDFRQLQIELFETDELPNFLLIQHDGSLTIHNKAFHAVGEFKDWLELVK